MKRMPFFLLIIAAVMMLSMTGCDSDDDLTFVEYTNPMANNPVNTIDWLKTAKDEIKQSYIGGNIKQERKSYPNVIWGGRIRLYTFQEQNYFEIISGGLGLKTELKFAAFPSECDIFDSQGNLCVTIVGGDVVSTLPGYEHLQNFWDVATFKSLLWEYKTTN